MKGLISSALLEIGLGFAAAQKYVSIAANHRIRGGSPVPDRYRGKMVEGKNTDFLFDTEYSIHIAGVLFHLEHK